MKAITLWQPWASAVALGSKTIETRHWSTNYRGPIAIHAARRRPTRHERFYDLTTPVWRGALQGDPVTALPYGAIVAIAEIVAVVPVEQLEQDWLDNPIYPKCGSGTWTERDMGDFSPGRFGWVLEDIQALAKPIPYNGQQGLFNIPDSLLPTS